MPRGGVRSRRRTLIRLFLLANLAAVSEKVINMHAAKTRLSQLVARAEKGERIVIARAGKPVAELGPTRWAKRASLPSSDPLLNLDEFAVEGPGGKLTNSEIDRVLYGKT